MPAQRSRLRILTVQVCLMLLSGPRALGLEVVYSGGNFSLPSTKFGRYFGKQTCDPIAAPVAMLFEPDQLCGPSFAHDYSGTILLVYDMVYPVGKIVTQGVEIDFGNIGCSKEAMYEKLATSGALAAVTMAIDPLPSAGEFLHGASDHDPDLYSRIPLLSLQIKDALVITNLLTQGEFVQLVVSCDEPNPMLPYLLAMSSMGLVFGLSDLALGFWALYFVANASTHSDKWCCRRVRWNPNKSFRASSKHSSNEASSNAMKIDNASGVHERARAKRRKVRGHMEIMLAFGIVNTVSGFVGVLGCNGSISHSFLVDDAHLHFGVKTFFASRLVGLKMFCILLVAIFWYEMSAAMRQMRSVESIFRTRPFAIIIMGVLVVLPNNVTTIIYASYLKVDLDTITWLYTSLASAVGVAFVVSGQRMIRQLKDHMQTIASTTRDQPEAMRGVRRFALHMARWLHVFAAFSLLQIVLVCVFVGGSLLFESPQAYVLAVVLIGSSSRLGARKGPNQLGTDHRTMAPRPVMGKKKRAVARKKAGTAPLKKKAAMHETDATAFLEDLEVEFRSRCKMIEFDAERQADSVRSAYSSEIIKLPKNIRAMNVREFCEKHGGQISSVLEQDRKRILESPNVVLQSAKVVSLSMSMRKAAKGPGQRVGTPGSALSLRNRAALGAHNSAFKRADNKVFSTPSRGLADTSGVSDLTSIFAGTPKYAGGNNSAAPTPATVVAAGRGARPMRRGESIMSVNGSPLVATVTPGSRPQPPMFDERSALAIKLEGFDALAAQLGSGKTGGDEALKQLESIRKAVDDLIGQTQTSSILNASQTSSSSSSSSQQTPVSASDVASGSANSQGSS
ncbi:Borealin [Hondaea fermentalgiana]|uniref:Borealin n=1 Tax=Hondaea fermentalgiana TaxID=2315210 RepID=A0A2R5GGW0_9STRA|nr:Borealin [Hondaea fermentalgiana]|eukprot:GBG29835.1 Borealin [Hondaea fermentalgiana]